MKKKRNHMKQIKFDFPRRKLNLANWMLLPTVFGGYCSKQSTSHGWLRQEMWCNLRSEAKIFGESIVQMVPQFSHITSWPDPTRLSEWYSSSNVLRCPSPISPSVAMGQDWIRFKANQNLITYFDLLSQFHVFFLGRRVGPVQTAICCRWRLMEPYWCNHLSLIGKSNEKKVNGKETLNGVG